MITKAQDTISINKKIEHQLDPFRIFNLSYYYNPANMRDYSDMTFSDIQLEYQNLEQDLYLLQDGEEQEKYRFRVNSYKKNSNNITLWGNASYTYSKVKNIRWNNNINLDRIAPYVIADAVGGDMNIQTYSFKGGVAKKIQKLTLGTELQYKADLSYKTTDPRPKNTTSDLTVAFGSQYEILPHYNIGLAVKLNRYLQTSTIKFSSEIEQTSLYHMNGLGTYHYYFSNRSNDASFEDFSHQYIFTLGNKNKMFSLSMGKLFGNLSKDAVTTGDNSYESNSLTTTKTFATVNKIFKASNRIKIGGKISYHKTDKKGTEVYYTNNNSIVEKLLEKETYQKDKENIKVSTVLQYKNNDLMAFVEPYFKYSNHLEKKKDINSQQKFEYNYIGIKFKYMQHFNHHNIWSLNTNLYMRHLKNNPNPLVTTNNEEINQWKDLDFRIKKTNFKALEISIRYDRQLQQKQTVFTKLGQKYLRFANGSCNQFYHLSLGFTF